jgi:benzylsuccinate CoA-transferase BbsE subunit
MATSSEIATPKGSKAAMQAARAHPIDGAWEFDAKAGALSGLRVLDLTSSGEQYCGKMLAQFGADVLLVEPIGGARSRKEGPFLHNTVHPEYSLQFAYFNQGKRGIQINLDTPSGQEVLRALAAQADVLIEAEVPGAMTDRGLDYDALKQLNPRLVMTSITSFGQTGPYAKYAGGDLVAMALGGLLYLGGYPETEPVGIPGNQALLMAAQFAAVATLIAVWDMERDAGNALGQHVDVSVQESVSMALETAVQFAELENTVRVRQGGHQRLAGMGVFPCKDGLVYLMAGGLGGGRFWPTSTEWLVEAGAPGAEALRDPRWLDRAFISTEEAKARFAEVFIPFASTRTKAELYEEAQRRRLPLCPVNTPKDVANSRQLAYRSFFQDTRHPYSGTTLTVPGAPFLMSGTPWDIGHPAPRLGEHNAAVLAALGYDEGTQAAMLTGGITG